VPELARRVSSEEILAEITRILRDELGVTRELSVELDLQRDLALDSLSLLTFVVSLEDHFRVVFREEDAPNIHTIAEVIAYIIARLEESC
jgi:acyl carrier protein